MRRLFIAMIAVGLLVFVPRLHSSTVAPLHTFRGGTDGADPLGDLVYDSTTKLVFGTTNVGGGAPACPHGCGTIFALHPDGTGYTVIYRFAGTPDGANPQAGLVLDGSGNLYGTTYTGGTHNLGTVFQLAPQGGGVYSETVLHSFSGADGSHPSSRLVLDASGNLYGTTFAGGAKGKGVVFELSKPVGALWMETVLHSFVGADGANPRAGVVFDGSGHLWGTTYRGGTASLGTVFELANVSGSWPEVFLFSFTGADGANPRGGVILNASGDVFGTTQFGGTPACAFAAAGCGVIFELQSNSAGMYTQSVLYSFTGSADGAAPLDALDLVMDSSGASYLYGTASQAGQIGGSCPALGCGTGFEVCGPASSCQGSTPWTEYTLFPFGGANGRTPVAGLLQLPPGVTKSRLGIEPKGRAGCTATCMAAGSAGGTGAGASGTVDGVTN
jgi:uncharacterized repeat protein (TIGR03803 family)